MPNNRGAPRQKPALYRRPRSDTSRKQKKQSKTEHIDEIRALKAEKKALVHAAKSVPCADCDLMFPVIAMDFDHQFGIKVDSVSTLAGDSKTTIEELQAEMDKCVVLCSCCHRIATDERRRAY